MMALRDQIAAEQAFKKFSLREPEARTPGRFTRLVRRLGFREREAEIRRCLDLVCAESLRPGSGWSSLNADGTPVQFALSLIEGRRPSFEFVGEAFQTGMEYSARRESGLERMTRLAGAIGATPELEPVRQPLETLAHGGAAGDGEDPAGAFWIGVSFEPEGAASMTVHANVRRGPEDSRWTRLAEFAGSVAEAEWGRIFAVAQAGTLKPLGAGVRITGHGRLHARVYFGAYGVTPQDYRRMFREAGAPEPFDRALAMFFEAALEAESAFPTQSAVFSFGSNGDGAWSPKLELCGHCAWNSDSEAEARCGTWLERLGMDADLYRDVIRILAGDRDSQESTCVHTYAGVGMRRDQLYASIYLNPGRGDL
jgi:hypothetical protein